jgi:hypothetical protein
MANGRTVRCAPAVAFFTPALAHCTSDRTPSSCRSDAAEAPPSAATATAAELTATLCAAGVTSVAAAIGTTARGPGVFGGREALTPGVALIAAVALRTGAVALTVTDAFPTPAEAVRVRDSVANAAEAVPVLMTTGIVTGAVELTSDIEGDGGRLRVTCHAAVIDSGSAMAAVAVGDLAMAGARGGDDDNPHAGNSRDCGRGSTPMRGPPASSPHPERPTGRTSGLGGNATAATEHAR